MISVRAWLFFPQQALRSGASAGHVGSAIADGSAILAKELDGRLELASIRRGFVGGGFFTSILRTTHRQNFLVPPRADRSFPLAELLQPGLFMSDGAVQRRSWFDRLTMSGAQSSPFDKCILSLPKASG